MHNCNSEDTRLSIKALCKLHYQYCASDNCFWKSNLLPSYFCVLPEALEGDCVPDSLQPGQPTP
ncbi:hypothetical protein OAdVAgp15 [Bovine adenovirus 2]|uniref:Uncharacterized protein n=1 Tax=Bovine adenovirus 2 TaxID=114429 RepID=A0A9W3N2C7_ADEB2|nr:hypothetical protein OAdVAgp15 [Bovine adenovirus 2]AAB33903.1 unknown [Bovine adenovirus 2]